LRGRLLDLMECLHSLIWFVRNLVRSTLTPAPLELRSFEAGHAARQRLRLSVAVVEHRISLPAEVYPRAPPGEQKAPGWTP